MQIVFILSGFVAGIALTYLFLSMRSSGKLAETEAKFQEAERQRSIAEDRLGQTTLMHKAAEEQLAAERNVVLELHSSLSVQKTNNDHLQEKLVNQKQELEQIHSKFTAEFENLSAKILEEKSKKFTEQNRTNLEILLNPLREQIKTFEEKVDLSYKSESAERNSLKGEIKSLIDLNKQVSEEANNLAKALKGDSKKQGNWGEVILERILERSGLTRGSEYEIQVSTTNDEGRRIQPDVIVYLPDNKHIIVDAKVSLVAYEKMVNANTDEERSAFLKEHISSIQSHVRSLSEKNYFTSPDLTSPDFVLIFMPIEPSFGVAIQSDSDLFNFAWERRIIIVSPTTLLATLRTISSIWKHEKQNRYAMEIAKVGGALYDKFFNFLKDMNSIGDKLKAAQQSHEDAMNKLSTGSGNIIRRVEEMKKLGAKATKELPQDIVEKAEESDVQ